MGLRRRVLVVAVVVTASILGVLPVREPTAGAVPREPSIAAATTHAVARGLFAAESAGGDAEAVADAVGSEASGEETGADGDEIAGGSPYPGANPPQPSQTVTIDGPTQPEPQAPESVAVRGPPGADLSPDAEPDGTELVDRRTERTKTYDTGHGTRILETSLEPVHVREDGEWVDIDLDLDEAEDGTFTNGPAPVDIELAEEASDDALATITLEGGETVAYGLEGAATVEPEVDGAIAVYEDVLPGVDIELESLADGLKETVVLASADAPSELTFPLDVDGATPRLDEWGGVVFEDDEGAVVAAVPPGFMVDSAPGGGARSEAVAYDLVEDGSGTSLVVTPDRAWLESPDRVWPVRVDPTTIQPSPFDDTYVKQGVTADHSGATELRAGPEGGANTAAYMRFYFGIPADALVKAATLSAWNGYSAGGCTPKPVNVYRVTSSWTGATMTSWPGASYSSTPAATGSFAKGGGPGCPAGWVQWDVTDLVDGWVSGTYSNAGISLRVPTGSIGDPGTFKRFSAGSFSKILVEYTEYGAAYTIGSNWHGNQPAMANQGAHWPVQVRNVGSVTWPAGGTIKLGTIVYPGTATSGTPVAQSRTVLPEAISPDEVIALSAHVPAIPPGTYTIMFEMVKEGDFWFSSEDGNRQGTIVLTQRQDPEFISNTPIGGDTVPTRSPALHATVDDPDDYPSPLQYYFRLCPGPTSPEDTHFPASAPGCQNSGWITSSTWTPPTPLERWNESAWWWVFYRDGSANAEFRVATPISVVPTPTQHPLATLAGAPGTASDGGVDLRTGGFSASVTDASVGWGDGAFSITRTYNSLAWRTDGVMGRGWSSILDVRIDVGNPPTPQPASFTLVRDDGRRETWAKNTVPSGATEHVYEGPLGSSDTLVWDVATNRYVLRTADRVELRFNSLGLLDTISRPGRPTIAVVRTSPWQSRIDYLEISDHIFDITYNADDRVSSVRSGAGGPSWTYTYNGWNLATVCDPRPAGERGCHVYTHQDYPVGLSGAPYGPLSRAETGGVPYLHLQHEIEANPRVQWREDGEDHRWTYAYSTQPCTGATTYTCRRTTITGPDVAADRPPGAPTPMPVIVDFDRFDRMVARRAENGYTRRWKYDVLGFINQEIDENGIATTSWYTSDGHLGAVSETRDGDPVTGSWPTTWYQYPSGLPQSDPRWGLPVWVWDGRGNAAGRSLSDATYLRYDTAGRLLERRTPSTPDAPVGRTEHFTYVPVGGDGEGQLLTYTDLAGRVTTNDYDADDRLESITTPTGLVTELDYTDEGWVETVTAHPAALPDPVVTTFTYDAIGNVVRVVGTPETNLVTTATYLPEVVRTFDPARHLTSETVKGTGSIPDRTTTYADFDGNGRPTRVTDPEGRATTTEWNWRGQHRTVDMPNGTRWTTHHSTVGLPARVSVTDLVEGGTTLMGSVSYDPAGRVATTVDATGTLTAREYWDDGRLRRVTIPNYRETSTSPEEVRYLTELDYDLSGNLTHELIRNEAITRVTTYDMANEVQRTELHGRYTEYDYRLDGQLDEVRTGDATHQDRTEYTYDPLPAATLATEVVHRGGGAAPYVTGYDWDDRGLMIARTRPDGRRTDYTHDTAGNLTTVTMPSVVVEAYGQAATTTRPTYRFGYDPFGAITHEEATDGRVTTTTYDGVGRLASSTQPPYSPGPGPALLATTSFAYDDAGRTETVTDELRGTSTTSDLDALGRTVTFTDPNGAETDLQYDGVGRTLATFSPLGAIERYGYDSVGNLTAHTVEERTGTPGAFTTRYGYDPQFDLSSITKPAGGGSTIIHQNPFGEPTLVVEPTGGSGSITTTTTRDHLGRAVGTSDGTGRGTTLTYDGAGVLTQATDVHGGTTMRTTTYGHNANLELTSVTTPGPNPGSPAVTTTYGRDGHGNLTSVGQPGGISTTHGYDIAGRRVRSTDGNGNATWYTYTPWGDLASVVDPATSAHATESSRTWTFRWEAPGLIEEERAPGGVVRAAEHDAAGNLLSETGTGGDADASRTYTYDAEGRPLTISSPNGVSDITWDDRGNIVGTTGEMGTSQLRYDGNGRMTSRIDDGAASTFTYWGSDLLKTATGDLTGATATYTYDTAGRPTSIAYGGGTTRSLGYDGFGNMATDTLSTGATGIATQYWTWGPDGEHLSSTTAGPGPLMGAGVETYTYDSAGRLIQTDRPGSSIVTTWDPAGNRLTNGTSTATYDQRSRVLTSGPPGAVESFTWTARGTLDASATAAGTTDYQFDAFDRLVREVGPGVDDTYRWDGLDRLASVDGTAHRYAGAEVDPVSVSGQMFERNPAGDVRGIGVMGQPGRLVRSNHRGDVAATFVPGATAVAASRVYTPFGQPTQAGPGQPSIGFQGDWTSGSGLVHMDARFYDPATGTFLSRDSWNLAPSTAAATNRYSYGAADPIGTIDPTGHACVKARANNCDGGQWDPPPDPPDVDYCLAVYPPRCTDDPCSGIETMSAVRTTYWCGIPIGEGGPVDEDGFRPPVPGDDGPGSSGGGGGGGGSGGPGRPHRPPPPPPPWWIEALPTEPPPTGHLVPPASPYNPTIQGSITLFLTPFKDPVLGLPTTGDGAVAELMRYQRPTMPSADGDGDGCITTSIHVRGAGWNYTQQGDGCDEEKTWCVGWGNGITYPGTCVAPQGDGGPSAATVFREALAAGGLVFDVLDVPNCAWEAYDLHNEDSDWGDLAWECGAVVPYVGSIGRWGNKASDAWKYVRRGTDAGRAAGRACSFSQDTRVLMADGSTKRISEVVVGDEVLAADPETGEAGTATVEAVRPHADVLLDLRTTAGTIVTTEDHPFWNATDGEWQPTQDLDPGDRLRSADGTVVTVAALDRASAYDAAAFDLDVEGVDDTYHVLVGDEAVLVHNSDYYCKWSALAEHSEVLDDFAHLDAGKRELAGEVVARKADGTPYNHVEEVRNAQRGVRNRIEEINRKLGWKGLGTEERAALVEELSAASKLLDRSEKYVPYVP